MTPNIITLAGQELSLSAARQIAAALVAEAAEHGTRFGDRKVFLGSIPSLDMADPACLSWLEDLRRSGLCTFARADLVAAMDPSMVEASEWTLGGGLVTYHFLQLY